jgi:hypothetical protein
MTHTEGDTFWYHTCPITDKVTFLPIGMKCPECVLDEMDTANKKVHEKFSKTLKSLED